MRKIVGLLAVAVLGSAMTFAQDASAPTLKVSGYVGAGLIYQSDIDSVRLHDSNNGSDGLRVSVDAVLDGGTYGVKAGISSNSVTSGFPGNLGANDTLGWVYLADKALKFSLGKVDDGQYATFVDGDFSWDGATGFALDISPVAGLTIGYLLPITFVGDTLASTVEGSQFAVAFTADKVISARAGINLAGLTDSGENLWAGVSLLAVENLTFQVDFEITGLGAVDADTSVTSLWEKAGYNFAPVSVAVLAEQVLNSDGLDNLRINPSVAFDLGSGSNANLSIDLNTHSQDATLGFTWNVNPYVNLAVAKNNVQIGANVGDNGAGGTAGTTGFDFYATFVMNF